jgi:hypothetical protein
MSRNSELVPRRAGAAARAARRSRGLFAVLAADRERAAPAGASRRFPRRSRSSCRSRPARAAQRVVDLVERLGLHLDEREFQFLLDVGLGALDRVEDLVQFSAPAASSRTPRILPWTSA